jgi:N utilization substance protein A
LAAQLTGWRLDIISKSKLQKRTGEALFNLQHIAGVNETLAQAIYQAGYFNVRAVAEAQLENLMKIPGYDTNEAAQNLKNSAKEVVEKAGDVLAVTPSTTEEGKGSFTATPTGMDAKSQAEARLREMFSKEPVVAGADKKESDPAATENQGE